MCAPSKIKRQIFKRSLNISRHRNSGHLNLYSKNYVLNSFLLFSKKQQNPWQVGIMHLFQLIEIILYFSAVLIQAPGYLCCFPGPGDWRQPPNISAQVRGGNLWNICGGCLLFRQPPNVWGSKVAPFRKWWFFEVGQADRNYAPAQVKGTKNQGKMPRTLTLCCCQGKGVWHVGGLAC